MKRLLPTLMMISISISISADEVVVEGHRFVIPDGFQIEKVAGSPLVDRPITATFDDRGRLYVADSSGTNDNVQKQLAERPHRIVRLEDTDGDGRFDKSTVFADRMMFPEGTMWLDGSLYVAAAPQIWKLTDTDDDGVADRREVWFDGKTLTGCANDLHGPYPGPDGRIYWAKGAFASQTYERDGKAPFATRAAHIFRAKPDGSEIEPVMTGGMDNPVDVVFTPGGERLVNGTFFITPGNGLRDGIIHAIYGGVYGKVHDPIFDPIHKWTGPEVMPILVHLGPAAPSGFHRYESSAFGPSFRYNVFNTCFNLHKVTRHVLTPKGATFEAETTDLVAAADNIDFHPTDLIEDGDGSLLIIDTGGWYKLCCPTSQLHKPDILGAIYRLRKIDAPRIDDPRGQDVAWSKLSGGRLFELLEDHRPAVRDRAVRALATRTDPTVAIGLRGVYLRLKQEAGKVEDRGWEARAAAIWAACRIDRDEARAVPLAALDDPHPEVRQAALHAIALWRRRQDAPALIAVLSKDDPHNQRAAAEGLGRIGDPSAVPALLEAVSQADDRILEHSLIYALIEIGDVDAIRSAPRSNEPARRAVLIAVDQLGGLDSKTIARELDAADPATREVAAWIAGRHPEWGADLAGYFRGRIDDPGLSTADREALETRLARFARGTEIQALLADRAVKGSTLARSSALRAMAHAGLHESPSPWSDAVLACLGNADGQGRGQALATARALPASKDPARAAAQATALLAISRDASQPESIRLDALAASPPGPLDDGLFEFLQGRCDPDLPADQRTAAADVLGRSKLTRPQSVALLATVRKAGPLELSRLLGAFDNLTDNQVGLALIDAIGESPAFVALRVDQILPRFAKLSPEVRAKADTLGKRLNADLETQRAKLEELLGRIGSGDVRRGQEVFHGPKAACITCHQMGYVGGKVGPDLTSIGKVRAERDLLEAIVFPSASFVRSYEPLTVATRDGRVLNGIVRRDTPEELVLATSATEEVRIARDDVDEVRPGTVSVMPAGLDQQLTMQELADLVAFLKASNR